MVYKIFRDERILTEASASNETLFPGSFFSMNCIPFTFNIGCTNTAKFSVTAKSYIMARPGSFTCTTPSLSLMGWNLLLNSYRLSCDDPDSSSTP